MKGGFIYRLKKKKKKKARRMGRWRCLDFVFIRDFGSILSGVLGVLGMSTSLVGD